jgi:hypothetical protein
MKYQEYIIGKEMSSDPPLFDFRKFSVPVRRAADRWLADPLPVSVPVLMRELWNSPRGVSEGGA